MKSEQIKPPAAGAAPQETKPLEMETLVALCKRRGFIYPNASIYGGLQGIYDYGPMGVELKNNLKQLWWQHMVYQRDDVEGLDSSILSHKLLLTYSGHADTFADMMVDCRNCKARWREDFVRNNTCGNCGSQDLTPARPFNMMFKTQFGPVPSDDNYAYLRPETAQGIFSNFKNILDSQAKKLPFGVAQIGKAFRNEITPRNFIFRVREFEQMELEFFVPPGSDDAWHQYWVQERYNWWLSLGLPAENLVLHQQDPKELAHYAKATTDILYKFPHGLEELEGIANRTDFDLGSHSKQQASLDLVAQVKTNTDSTERLAVQDLEHKRWQVPFVIEPSAGVDRGVLALLAAAYTEEILADNKTRVVLKLHPKLAPIKAAIVPIAKNNQDITGRAKAIKQQLQQLGLGRISYEDTGNIGKAYRRHDEVGTPLCITVDFETIGQGDAELANTVTIRNRDSMQQFRLNVTELPAYLQAFYASL